jgi:hypothetical protein
LSRITSLLVNAYAGMYLFHDARVVGDYTKSSPPARTLQ